MLHLDLNKFKNITDIPDKVVFKDKEIIKKNNFSNLNESLELNSFNKNKLILPVGSADGLADGFAVGAVGLAVGECVGSWVGSAIGTRVGKWVGSAIGNGVGKWVGLAIGGGGGGLVYIDIHLYICMQSALST